MQLGINGPLHARLFFFQEIKQFEELLSLYARCLLLDSRVCGGPWWGHLLNEYAPQPHNPTPKELVESATTIHLVSNQF
ncbi:MAG: hypothetical protein JMM75_01945 [Candidatus Xiphinematobacter sp.]|nr:MAG: hypothetical protein JMM75_01945 [Candidatus Xiphinematobacter sp.]